MARKNDVTMQQEIEETMVAAADAQPDGIVYNGTSFPVSRGAEGWFALRNELRHVRRAFIKEQQGLLGKSIRLTLRVE